MTERDERQALEEYDENELIFHPDGRLTRKHFLVAGAAAAASGPLIFSKVAEAAPLDASKLPYKANTNVKGSLEFWHFWSSPLRRGAIHSAIKQFQSVYKHVTIHDLPVPFANIYDKLAAAVTAGSGVPDIVISNRLTIWSDVPQHHLYVDLTPYYAKTPVSGSLYWPVTWQQVHVKQKGKQHIYGLPFETDIRVLYINRGALVANGFGASQTPRTWAQLASMADKIDQKGSKITFWPFDAEGLDDLVWLAGGDWQDKKQHPTANSAANIKAADWAKSYVDRAGGQSGYNALKSKITNPALDLFASGLQVMKIDQPTYQDFTLVQNGVNLGIPNNSDPKISKIFPYWNVGLLPTESSKIKPWSFSGGFSVSVPRAHRSAAKTEAAWEFIKFMSLVGQATFEQFAGNIPTVIKQAHDPALMRKSHWPTFLTALKYQHKLTQNKWDAAYPGDVTAQAQNDVLGGSSGKDALDKAQNQALANMKRNGGP